MSLRSFVYVILRLLHLHLASPRMLCVCVVSCTFSPVIKFKDELWALSEEARMQFNGIYRWYTILLVTYVMITLTGCATTRFAN